jgi:hypothetical protein
MGLVFLQKNNLLSSEEGHNPRNPKLPKIVFNFPNSDTQSKFVCANKNLMDINTF